jgi:hypothetical protein
MPYWPRLALARSRRVARFGPIAAKSRPRPRLSPRSQAPAARDRRGVLLSAAQVTWHQFLRDGRLAQALGACEENGWEALPLASKELTRLFPELWRTRKAAEDWARKNPLNPIVSIIRLWGVLNTYRPPGQTSWSKALVRRGADLRTALAAVLKVAPEYIHSREPAGTDAGPVRLNPQPIPETHGPLSVIRGWGMTDPPESLQSIRHEGGVDE